MRNVYSRLLKIYFLVGMLAAITASVACANGEFFTINNNNIGKVSLFGEITKTGHIPALYNIDNLTYNSADSNFYTISNDIFCKISPAGQITPIREMRALAMDYDVFVDIAYNSSDGNFYALNANHLTKIAPSGALTEICDLGIPFGDYNKFERLCYNASDGNFYATNSNHLVKITPGGQLTEIRDLMSSVLYYDVFRCLCYNASDGNLYSINNNHLVKITTAGVVSEVCLIPSSSLEFDTLRNIAWVPSESSAPHPYRIGALKNLSTATLVAIDDAVVSAVNIEPGVAFAVSSNRISGVKLITNQALAIGQRINFTGTAEKINGECQISNLQFGNNVISGAALPPLGVTSRSFQTAAAANAKQSGISSSGLLVRYTGMVNSSKPIERTIYVDDGGNAKDGLSPDSHGIRVRIPAGAAMPQNGDIVVITGVSRVEKAILPAGGTVYIPCIWPRYSSDVRVVSQ